MTVNCSDTVSLAGSEGGGLLLCRPLQALEVASEDAHEHGWEHHQCQYQDHNHHDQRHTSTTQYWRREGLNRTLDNRLLVYLVGLALESQLHVWFIINGSYWQAQYAS